MTRLPRYTPVGILLGLVWTASLPLAVRAVDGEKVKAWQQQALTLEKKHEWGQACLQYKKILDLKRDDAGVKAKYLHCLRRYLQTHRHHQDPSFKKELLTLRYSQALELYEDLLTYLLQNTLDHQQLTPEELFRKGLEELDYALADPRFVRTYLPRVPAAKIEAIRASLPGLAAGQPIYSVQDAANRARQVALELAKELKLNLTVTIMEFTCGSCYAIDEYTLYLTPNDLRQLSRSLKGEYAPSVEYHLREDGIGYLAIRNFQDSTVSEVDGALLSLNKLGMKALIIDLRGNSGGLVEPAIDVARRFLTTGVIVSTKTQAASKPIVYQARNPDAMLLPLVVLIDGGTASAAEILAGALKENESRGARLVGQTTFGKGCIQELYRLASRNGSLYPGGLRLTVTRYFSPNGTCYTGKGVVPHVPVEAPPEPVADLSADPQYAAAVAEALGLIGMNE